jgi:hypothetical protein
MDTRSHEPQGWLIEYSLNIAAVYASGRHGGIGHHDGALQTRQQCGLREAAVCLAHTDTASDSHTHTLSVGSWSIADAIDQCQQPCACTVHAEHACYTVHVYASGRHDPPTIRCFICFCRPANHSSCTFPTGYLVYVATSTVPATDTTLCRTTPMSVSM